MEYPSQKPVQGAVCKRLIAIEHRQFAPTHCSHAVQPFHAYAVGNLGWEPAFEVEAATTAMALRVYKDEPSLPPDAAVDRLRGAITARIQVSNSPSAALYSWEQSIGSPMNFCKGQIARCHHRRCTVPGKAPPFPV